MDRVLAVTVLLLVQAAPHWCRRLSVDHSRSANPLDLPPDEYLGLSDDLLSNHLVGLSHDHVGLSDHEGLEEPIDSNEHTSAERFGYLPSPNLASPLLSPFIYPPLASTPSLFKPDVFSNPEPSVDRLPPPIFPTASVSTSSDHIQAKLVTDYWSPQTSNKHHKIRVNKLYNDEGKLWTKFPHTKHLVEIVPIRPKDKLIKGKGKALAYILPNSNIIKQKLNKKKPINGIFIDKPITDLNNINLESSEENSSIDDSADLKDSGASENSDSAELSNSEYDHKHPNLKAIQLHDSFVAPAHQKNENDNVHNLDELIDNKTDDVVNYFKNKNDVDIDNGQLIHDLLLDSEDDPDYHYIIHKKYHSNEDIHNTDHTAHNLHHKHPAQKDLNVINDGYLGEELVKQLNLIPQDQVYSDYVNVPSNTHAKLEDSNEDIDMQKKLSYFKESNKQTIHSSHHVIDPYHDKIYNIINEIDPNTGNVDEIQTIPHQNYRHVHAHADNNDDNIISVIESEPLDIREGTSKSQINSVSTSLSTESIEESNEPIADINDSQKELEATESSSESGDSTSSSESNHDITNDGHSHSKEESAELHAINNLPKILHPDDVLPNLYSHGLDHNMPSEESSSEEKSIEKYLEKLHHHENSAEITLNNLVGQNLKILPDGFKLKNQKANGHPVDCFGHKSYKLTFVFNG